MKTATKMTQHLSGKAACSTVILLAALTLGACSDDDGPVNLRLIAQDLNNADNPVIQPQDPALAGGGRDQSLQFGDVIIGQGGNDLLVGGLGVDVLNGNGGDDIIIGGTEDFNPQNRDRAFGRAGNDVFIWAPGDGSDFFDGGAGHQDTVIFGLLGENDGSGSPAFGVQQDQNFDPLFFDADGNPVVDVTNSPGFCSVVDSATSNQAATELANLDLDHLVRFSIRGIADAFALGSQNTDNGLRVTLHLKDVEFLVCTTRAGNGIQVLDLTTQPPTEVSTANLPEKVQGLIQ
ncbi:MAG: calcium-binding protein [Thiolinea sp.]